jgi:hypothetical protein
MGPVNRAMNFLRQFFREILWFAGLSVCAWFFPRTVLGTEVICGLGTMVLYRVEKGVM